MKNSSVFITLATLIVVLWLWESPQPTEQTPVFSSQPVVSNHGKDFFLVSANSAFPSPLAASSSVSLLSFSSRENPQPSIPKQRVFPNSSSPAEKERSTVAQPKSFSPNSPLSSHFSTPSFPVDFSISFPVFFPEKTETVELPADLPLPIVLVDAGLSSSAPIPVAAKQEEIAQIFLDEILLTSTETEEGDAEVSDASWYTAKASADHLFKILYGDAAYNQKSIQATLQSNQQP